VTSTGTVPGGIEEGIFYFVVVDTSTTIKLATTANGTAINITSAGSGTITIRKDPNLTEDGERRIKDIELPLTNSPWTAQRLARIELERIRRDISVQAPCMVQALTLCPGDSVRFLCNRYSWHNDAGTTLNLSSVDHASNTFSTSPTAHGLSDGDALTISSTGALPEGIESNFAYFVSVQTSTTFKVSKIRTGENGNGVRTVGKIVDLTSNGSGVLSFNLRQGKVFIVNDCTIVSEEVGDGIAFGVNLGLRETHAEIYDWTVSIDAENVQYAPG
jgi:hypothetical protein